MSANLRVAPARAPGAPRELPADSIAYASVAGLRDRLAKRELSPVEVVDVLLERIGRYDSALHAFVTVTAERARSDARKALELIERGRPTGPLCGIPYGLKDVIENRGHSHDRPVQDPARSRSRA